MKQLFTLVAVMTLSATALAQPYQDVLRFSTNHARLGNIDNARQTDVANLQAEVIYPFPISASTILVGGFTYENTRLGLNHTADRSNLVMTRLNLGTKLALPNRMNLTLVALPKFASDFAENIADEDFQMGGIAILDKKYSSRFTMKYGAYVSSENFGTTITPIVGLYYQSENRKLTIDGTLPIRADITYNIVDDLNVGANLLTSIKSYNLTEFDSQLYVQEESIRFALFGSIGLKNNTYIFRGKVGFDTTDYGVYNAGDVVGAQILTFQPGGDDRLRLNSEFDSSLYFGLDFIYRLPL